jgi:hypothetical protein
MPSGRERDGNRAQNVLFFTTAGSKDELDSVRLLVESLREFGGQLSSCPIWLFDFGVPSVDYDLLADLSVKTIDSTVPDATESYELAQKVHSCAEAERLASPNVESLIWIGPDTLIVNPPDLYILGDGHDAALRPVHIKNVGLAVDEPLDEYWSRILEAAGAEQSTFSVESFIDRRRLRGYFNSHSYCVRRSLGLFRRWSECFENLVRDDDFQSSACSDELRRIFLHQAVLSALTLSMVDHNRSRILPSTYSYPYNLQSVVQATDRADAIGQLTSIVYEDRSLDPDLVRDIDIGEPLRSWLRSRFGRP